MYAGCSKIECRKKCKYLIDVKNRGGEIETHTRCSEHKNDFRDKTDILQSIDIHDSVMPLSEGGSGTNFKSNCSFCSKKRASEIVRFEDSFDAVSTEARCAECTKKIAENRDLLTRKKLNEVSIRAEDCE